MSITASGDGLSSFEDEDLAGLPPSVVVATAESDPELMAMLSQAAVILGLEVCTPPSPEPSRLDDGFLGAGSGSRPRPPPSSPPSMAGQLGVMWTLRRWREQLRCTCARKTPPLGGSRC